MAHHVNDVTLRAENYTTPGDITVHHVREYADGGPTHTDNGVLLCWHHHRTLHLSLWEVRMNAGMPEIRGPAWWDHEYRWRPARRPSPVPVGSAPPGH